MCGRPPPHPSRAPSQGPGCCRQAWGTPHSWGRFSSALGCSVAFQPSPPPLAGPRWAGARVSLCPSLFPAPALGTRAGTFAPQQSQGLSRTAPLLSLRKQRRPLERAPSPSFPLGLEMRCHDATKPTRRACAGGVAQTTLPPVLGPCSGDELLDESCSSFRPETCWWGEGSPQGSQTSGRQAVGASALLPLLVSQAGPGPSEVLWFSLVPPLPSEPSPPPHPSPLPLMPRSDLGLSTS